MSKQKRNWLIDTGLFISFLLTFFLNWTGLAWHQWLGISISLIALYHLLLHWKWIITVTKRFFGKTSHQCRLYYLIDWSLLVSFGVIGITGLVISTWLNFNLSNYLVWKNLHIDSSIAGLVIILIKIAAHWRWIINTAAKYFGFWGQAAPAKAAARALCSPSSSSLNRRGFLQLMGVASFASMLSAANLLEFGEDTDRELVSDVLSSDLQETTTLKQNQEDCTVLCDQGCTYPGECRRYQDKNENGICDLTECIEEGANTSTFNDPETPTAIEENTSDILENTEEDCVVLCAKACVFPGQCLDYIDMNNNNICDLGECLTTNATLSIPTISEGGGKRRRGGK